jgi:hypothetical protein
MPKGTCGWERIRLDVVFPRHQFLCGLLEYRKDTLTAGWYFCTRRLCLNNNGGQYISINWEQKQRLHPLDVLSKCVGRHRRVPAIRDRSPREDQRPRCAFTTADKRGDVATGHAPAINQLKKQNVRHSRKGIRRMRATISYKWVQGATRYDHWLRRYQYIYLSIGRGGGKPLLVFVALWLG